MASANGTFSAEQKGDILSQKNRKRTILGTNSKAPKIEDWQVGSNPNTYFWTRKDLKL